MKNVQFTGFERDEDGVAVGKIAYFSGGSPEHHRTVTVELIDEPGEMLSLLNDQIFNWGNSRAVSLGEMFTGILLAAIFGFFAGFLIFG